MEKKKYQVIQFIPPMENPRIQNVWKEAIIKTIIVKSGKKYGNDSK